MFTKMATVYLSAKHKVVSYGDGAAYEVWRRSLDGKLGRSILVQDEAGCEMVDHALDQDDIGAAIERELGDFLDASPIHDILNPKETFHHA